MGMDVSDIRNIVHVGPPSTLESFVQEIGRCGRDGAKGKSCLYFNSSDLSKTHLTKEMKEYCTTEGCRRELLLNHFNFKVRTDQDKHYCCDNCSRACKCELCSTDYEETDTTNEVEPFPRDQISNLREMLTIYFKSENGIVESVGSAELRTGLSKSLIDNICKKVPTSLNQLETSYPFLTSGQIMNIHKIIHCLYAVKA
ncbi:bifunctional 3'-5' exonuclease/ATP-dependent helicase WRN-like [Mercenaria mercenaria]|uniref:bifunctional 3'-5' exonuclease/ATP-dependent helicase WRN-like n=1 Tax=Mercenaria mercenaria TaxID=6596 RepID=UPI00234F7D10|nr:bifunctional 3'-5' exonuclease/ATP-dependent helicase WRN-like [Mercenaria mercenaria]